MGMSDLIAGFIQSALDDANGVLELQRSDLAQQFGCVPSQINYVMSTRSSPERGYIVEARRGGGGGRCTVESACGITFSTVRKQTEKAQTIPVGRSNHCCFISGIW